MKKILQIIDIHGWAIDELAKSIVEKNPQFEWLRMAIHPKDLEAGKVDLTAIREAVLWADVIDVHYWRVLSLLLKLVPEIKTKKIVLTHHNEKNLLDEDWKDVAIHVAQTNYSRQKLAGVYGNHKVVLCPNTFDENTFHFVEELPKEHAVGYVGRIVPWKGLKEICRACFELGLPLYLMGKHDKTSYWESIPEEHRNIIRWDFFNCSYEDRPEIYKNITCYVGFSGSGRETGTLGFIDALASGVPVVTTLAGLAADIAEEGENMMTVDFDDVEELKQKLSLIMGSKDLREKIRRKGWETIKNFNHTRRCYQYREIYNKLLFVPPLVSVVIPSTIEREAKVIEILKALELQTHKSIEAVVVWDEKQEPRAASLLNEKDFYFPIFQKWTDKAFGYNLAMARNIGAIEANGRYIFFCDSRLKPMPDAIEKFVQAANRQPNKTWFFGEKGGGKQSFVENFSFINRNEFIRAGMCNERINRYGGMSQELRERFTTQGFATKYIPDAKAEQTEKACMTPDRRSDIIAMKNQLYKMGL